jgi:hypothetical protein
MKGCWVRPFQGFSFAVKITYRDPDITSKVYAIECIQKRRHDLVINAAVYAAVLFKKPGLSFFDFCVGKFLVTSYYLRVPP